MREAIFTAPKSGLYSCNEEIFFELSDGDKYVGLPKVHLDALRVRVDELEKENEELKLHIAGRSEKYKIAMDKGVDVLSAEIKELKAKLEKAESVLKYYADRTNYTLDDDFVVSGEMRRRVNLYGDQEEFNEFSSVAGRRAREYLRGEG